MSTEEEASLYVLGMLPPEEARKFEAAMAADPELAQLAGRIRRKERELANVLVPFPGWKPWLPWAAAACLATAVGCLVYDRYHFELLVAAFLLRDRINQEELDRVHTALAVDGREGGLEARDGLSQIKITTLASMNKEAPQAMAVVAWDGATQRGIVKMLNMPAAGSDQDYQLWIIDPDQPQPVSAGVFDPGQTAGFQPAHPISKAGKFAISLEKKGGSPAPREPFALVGE
jgi:anti-sigma-K factor RskA